MIAPADPLLTVGASSPHFDPREWDAHPTYKVVAYDTAADCPWPLDAKQAPWRGPHIIAKGPLANCIIAAAEYMEGETERAGSDPAPSLDALTV